MKLPIYSAGLILGLAAGTLHAQSTFPVNQFIPDGNPVGLAVTGMVTNFSNYSLVTSVTLGLNVSGGYNGDLYAELVSPDGGVVTLFNQPGVTTGNPFGFAGSGMNVTFSDLAIATLQSSPETAGSTVTGQYQPLTALNTLDYTHADGAWTLLIADEADGGGQATLVSWDLNFTTAVPEPSTLALLGISSAALLARLRRR